MTTGTLAPDAGELNLTADEYYEADAPPDEPPASEVPVPRADGEPPPDPVTAPHGWTRDRGSDTWRPKKLPGRARKPPAPPGEVAATPPVPRAPDKPPGPPAATRRPPPPPGPDPAAPAMPRGGVIAKGVNRLYRRAGKIVRAMDADIGTAIIECTRADDDGEDLTVGEAWENLAKGNPRIRAWIMRILDGGAWGDLIMAHAPIAMAIMLKPAIASRLPFQKLIGSWLERDEDTQPDDLQPADVDDMAATARAQADRMARRMGVTIPPGVMDQAQKQAERMAADGNIPPGLRRAQPKRQTRAARKGGK